MRTRYDPYDQAQLPPWWTFSPRIAPRSAIDEMREIDELEQYLQERKKRIEEAAEKKSKEKKSNGGLSITDWFMIQMAFQPFMGLAYIWVIGRMLGKM